MRRKFCARCLLLLVVVLVGRWAEVASGKSLDQALYEEDSLLENEQLKKLFRGPSDSLWLRDMFPSVPTSVIAKWDSTAGSVSDVGGVDGMIRRLAEAEHNVRTDFIELQLIGMDSLLSANALHGYSQAMRSLSSSSNHTLSFRLKHADMALTAQIEKASKIAVPWGAIGKVLEADFEKRVEKNRVVYMMLCPHGQDANSSREKSNRMGKGEFGWSFIPRDLNLDADLAIVHTVKATEALFSSTSSWDSSPLPLEINLEIVTIQFSSKKLVSVGFNWPLMTKTLEQGLIPGQKIKVRYSNPKSTNVFGATAYAASHRVGHHNSSWIVMDSFRENLSAYDMSTGTASKKMKIASTFLGHQEHKPQIVDDGITRVLIFDVSGPDGNGVKPDNEGMKILSMRSTGIIMNSGTGAQKEHLFGQILFAFLQSAYGVSTEGFADEISDDYQIPDSIRSRVIRKVVKDVSLNQMRILRRSLIALYKHGINPDSVLSERHLRTLLRRFNFVLYKAHEIHRELHIKDLDKATQLAFSLHYDVSAISKIIEIDFVRDIENIPIAKSPKFALELVVVAFVAFLIGSLAANYAHTVKSRSQGRAKRSSLDRSASR